MSDILGGLLFAGIAAALLTDDGEQWNDEVGTKFNHANKELIATEKQNIKIIVDAVENNSNALASGVSGLANKTDEELKGYIHTAEGIRDEVRAMNPQMYYDQSRQLQNTVK